MLLTADIRNAHTALALFETPTADDALGHWRVSTERRRTSDEWAVLVRGLVRDVATPDQLSGIAVGATVPDVEVVGDPTDRLPHVVTFSCLYVDGEALVTELDRRGFGIASGSACTASTLTPSHVLAAMGVLTHGNVRLSLTRETTDDDVDRFLAVLPEVVAELRARVGP